MSASPSMTRLLVFCLVFLVVLISNMVMARLMPMEGDVLELKLGRPKDAPGPSIDTTPHCGELGADSRPQGKNHRYSSMKVLGGHVILIGLTITSIVIIFAYIWVTRGRNKKSMMI